MFTKVLIANRGAIAVRIIRTLKEMGITSVAVYAQADKDSLHVSLADVAVNLGEGGATQTYLNQQKLLEIIKEHNVDAVHPGYGFLSENPDFSRLLKENNIAFIGPEAEQMMVFSLKHKARELAQSAGVPLVPGSDILKDLDEALNFSESIGYPIILKSTAGGGGIGMQICDHKDQLIDAFDKVKHLGAQNFSNDDVFIEKFIGRARHIEVQIIGNGSGDVVALGERDCSPQRRNQKVVEETPAPNLDEDIRQDMHQTAERLMAQVNYKTAGTVEFIYDIDAKKYYFLEVNTRLQVEHGVTEQVFNVDLVHWMLKTAFDPTTDLSELKSLIPSGHAMQVRLYAEDPVKNFQPSTGLLTHVNFATDESVRVDTWVSAGIEVSSYFDPMIAKVIVHEKDRNSAIKHMSQFLEKSELYGIRSNLKYLQTVLKWPEFLEGMATTKGLDTLPHQESLIEVISPGTLTTIQDHPARKGYWHIGIPPSGAFDHFAFDLGNALLGNDPLCAGLEFTIQGGIFKFHSTRKIVLTGANMSASIDDTPIEFNEVIQIQSGQVLKIGKLISSGTRAYLSIEGGIDCPEYLGSRSTFTLGQFGGHAGRALRTADMIALNNEFKIKEASSLINNNAHVIPKKGNTWNINVMYGPHGAPDFFTKDDIQMLFDTKWEVHYNSSRTGVRLIGPKPNWAREDGGEAGLHPSNIHDNAYAFGTVDFTGDMPVILGPDGPSLGGFVCPVTVIDADLWKLGQLSSGDKIQFIPVDIDQSVEMSIAQKQCVLGQSISYDINSDFEIDNLDISTLIDSPLALAITPADDINTTKVVYRPQGDRFLLVEYGESQLDLTLRFRAQALLEALDQYSQLHNLIAIEELTPGIRSLQIHYDSTILPQSELLSILMDLEKEIGDVDDLEFDSRIVHIPLSWDDPACKLAIEKYDQSVRPNAPWAPSNIEFIRRINGLASAQEVKNIVFDASYLVMGLGDVYLGAPVATPMNPAHRLVTTKYNPARTWTAENSVGIGGAYMCVYGMEGPGGYQFVGRTLQMWNRYRKTSAFSRPWLLRFFDQIRFYEVSHDELSNIREDFIFDRYKIKIEQTKLNLKDYRNKIDDNQKAIERFTKKREQAFQQELTDWKQNGQFTYEQQVDNALEDNELELTENEFLLECPAAGNLWQIHVKEGQTLKESEVALILESMKMELEVNAPQSGKVKKILVKAGQQIDAGQALMVIEQS